MTEKIAGKAAEAACQMKNCCMSLKETAIRHKKQIKNLFIALIVLMALCGIGHAIFTVDGVVTGVSGDTITVTNFFGGTDVTLGEPWKSNTDIKAGDHVRIVKNLQGTIISVRTGSERDSNRESGDRFMKDDKNGRMDKHGQQNNGQKINKNDRSSEQCNLFQNQNKDQRQMNQPGTVNQNSANPAGTENAVPNASNTAAPATTPAPAATPTN